MRNGVYGGSPETGEGDPLVNEEVVGNVSKMCVLPPGYRGPPRKGHLIFDANFESGKFFACIVKTLIQIKVKFQMCIIRQHYWLLTVCELIHSIILSGLSNLSFRRPIASRE